MQIVVENGRAHKGGDFEEGHSIDWDRGPGGRIEDSRRENSLG